MYSSVCILPLLLKKILVTHCPCFIMSFLMPPLSIFHYFIFTAKLPYRQLVTAKMFVEKMLSKETCGKNTWNRPCQWWLCRRNNKNWFLRVAGAPNPCQMVKPSSSSFSELWTIIRTLFSCSDALGLYMRWHWLLKRVRQYNECM